MGEVDWMARFRALVEELQTNPLVEVGDADLVPPSGDPDATIATTGLASTPVGAALSRVYRSVGAVKLRWRLAGVPNGLALDPEALEGAFELLPLDEVVRNDAFHDLHRHGAHPVRGHAVCLDDLGFAASVLPEEDRIVLVGDDGVELGTKLSFEEYLDLAIRCRGTRHFAAAVEGHRDGARTLAEVLRHVFGERDVTKIAPVTHDDPRRALFATAERVFARHGVPAKVSLGRTGDPAAVYVVVPDAWNDPSKIAASMRDLFPRSQVSHVGVQVGELALMSQLDFDRGVLGDETVAWELLHEALVGAATTDEVGARCDALVAAFRSEGRRGVARCADLRGVQDLLVALDAEADSELRELARLSVAEWRDRDSILRELKAARWSAARRKVVERALDRIVD
ncbi:MAG: hypothetical protein H6722_29715 [Sandaracinus sp.]|nr:hypothetical protein [Sandaracinus sp.]